MSCLAALALLVSCQSSALLEPPTRSLVIGDWRASIAADRQMLVLERGGVASRLPVPEAQRKEASLNVFHYWSRLQHHGRRLFASFVGESDTVSSPTQHAGIAEFDLGSGPPRLVNTVWLPAVNGVGGAGLFGGYLRVLAVSESRMAVYAARDTLAPEQPARVFVLRRPDFTTQAVWTVHDPEMGTEGGLSGWTASEGAPSRHWVRFHADTMEFVHAT